MTTSLAILAHGRDNNLNLIRIIAAGMVLVSHSFVIASGDPQAEPWHALIGRSPGGLAVDIFFVISGFLVTASAMKQASVGPYLLARGLRIYPGLWVAILLSVLVVGCGYSSLSWSAFFADPQTWRYILRNAVMIAGGEGALPGSFPHNPFGPVVNGSLWTLRYELRLYVLLAMGWWLIGRWARQRPERPMAAWLSFMAVALSAGAVVQLWTPWSSDFLRLGGMFFVGAAVWVWRDHLPMNGWVVFLGLLAMGLAATVSVRVFEPAYRLAMPYAVFWLAYRPGGWLRAYNRAGDYSYGVYIYAFPVQQMLVASMPGLGVWQLTAAAGAITGLLAILSWHLVEQPALAWRHRFWPSGAVDQHPR